MNGIAGTNRAHTTRKRQTKTTSAKSGRVTRAESEVKNEHRKCNLWKRYSNMRNVCNLSSGSKPMIYEAFIKAEPVAKQRPRLTRSGHAYTPAKTRDYEALIHREWVDQCGETAIEGAIEVNVTFGMRVPKSFSSVKRSKALSGEIKPAVRPDIDNLVKAVLDALNGVAFKDDGQITKINALKVYSESPCVWVVIKG